MTAHWSIDAARLAARRHDLLLPVIAPGAAPPIVPGHDLWDMWQVMSADGSTAILGGRSWWYFLAVPRPADPEERHDAARIRLTSHGADGWRDHGWTFDAGFTPGSREWSGSAVLDAAGAMLTMYFTASGRREGGPRFEQRLFETRAPFAVIGGEPRTGRWSVPIESIVADGHWCARADQSVPGADGIKGFRDPGYFRDPADGRDYLTFTGSAGWTEERFDGIVGLAAREGGGWAMRPPILAALGVNTELERPHLIARDGLYYLFWSTQGRRFAPGIGAPTGLYAMVASAMTGPWRPVNGSGLVAGNPAAAPFQAYCWWVTAEGDAISFVDYPGVSGPALPETAAARRAAFGGTAAPWLRLAFDGDRIGHGGARVAA